MATTPRRNSEPDPVVASRIAERLVGQCMRSIEDEVEELDRRDDVELLRAIDAEVFCCDCCGWYCSTDELNNSGPNEGRQVCDECVDEDNEEEE